MDRLEKIKQLIAPLRETPGLTDSYDWLIAEVERLRDLVSTKIEQVEFLNRSLIDECKRLNAEIDRLRKAEGRRSDFDEQVNLTGGGR